MRVLPTYVCSNHLLRFSTGVVQSFPGIRLLIVVDTLKVHFVTLENVPLVASSLLRMIYAPLAARGRRWFTLPSVCTDRWCPFQGQGNRHAAEECLLRIQRKDVTVDRRQSTVGVSHLQNIVEMIAAPLVVLRQVLAHQQGDVRNSGCTSIEDHRSCTLCGAERCRTV